MAGAENKISLPLTCPQSCGSGGRCLMVVGGLLAALNCVASVSRKGDECAHNLPRRSEHWARHWTCRDSLPRAFLYSIPASESDTCSCREHNSNTAGVNTNAKHINSNRFSTVLQSSLHRASECASPVSDRPVGARVWPSLRRRVDGRPVGSRRLFLAVSPVPCPSRRLPLQRTHDASRPSHPGPVP